jgi:hypothetical protein
MYGVTHSRGRMTILSWHGLVQILNISTSELKQANTVQLYLEVLTIADLTSPNGQEIPDGNMSGDWHWQEGGSDIHWLSDQTP